MADCELLPGCIFFNDRMANIPATAELMKVRYCRGINSNCARYTAYKKLGREKVPPDLYPNDLVRANNISSAK
jgi:hypothetical protein